MCFLLSDGDLHYNRYYIRKKGVKTKTGKFHLHYAKLDGVAVKLSDPSQNPACIQEDPILSC